MRNDRARRAKITLWGALVLVGLGAVAFFHSRALDPSRHLLLPDGTEVFLHRDAKAIPVPRFPEERELSVNGEMFFRVPECAVPLTVRTSLLVLTVKGASAFRMTAPSKAVGQQAEVLYGSIEVRKNYSSTHNQPEVLIGGQMVMINRGIDLMEKETADLPQLRAWSDALVAAAEGE